MLTTFVVTLLMTTMITINNLDRSNLIFVVVDNVVICDLLF